MLWLQENWIIAVVGLVVAVILLWFLFGRKKPEEIEAPLAPPTAPKKPLEAVKPEIIAAEPARFKPKEPAPAPVAATPPPPPPTSATAPEPKSDPAPKPVAKIPEEPTVPAEPVAETPAAEPKPKSARAAKPKRKPAAAIPAEPTVPAPAPKPAPKPTKRATKPAASPEPAPAPAPTAKTDNLQLLKGVGPKMVALLNGLGVTGFQQIADWTEADVAAIDPQLGAFQGRIARDAIVDQASYLARGDKAGFEAKYGALGGEL